MKKTFQALVLSFLAVTTANAEIKWSVTINDTSEKVGTFTVGHSATLTQVLEAMPWIEEGSQSGEGKYLYIFYAPDSAESQALYQQTRPLLEDVNIRWIPIQGHGESLNGLYETRTPEALKNAFTKQQFPAVQNPQKMEVTASMVMTAFIYLRHNNFFSPEIGSYFPTIFYGTEDEMTAYSDPKNIETIITQIPATTPNSKALMMEQFAETPYKIFPVQEYAYFANEEGGIWPIYLYPNEKATHLGFTDNRLPIKGITDNGFLAIDIQDGKGRYVFMKYFKDNVEISNKAKSLQ